MKPSGKTIFRSQNQILATRHLILASSLFHFLAILLTNLINYMWDGNKIHNNLKTITIAQFNQKYYKRVVAFSSLKLKIFRTKAYYLAQFICQRHNLDRSYCDHISYLVHCQSTQENHGPRTIGQIWIITMKSRINLDTCRLGVVVEPACRTLTIKIVRASPGVGGGVRVRVPEVTFLEVTFPEETFPEMTVLHVFRK